MQAILPETSPFLSAQIAVLSSFFQMFIVLGMYNFVTRLEIIHLVDVSLRELEFQLSKGRRSLVAAEKKSYFRTLTGLFLYWVSLLLNVIKGHLKVHENASLMLLCYHTELFLQIRFTGK